MTISSSATSTLSPFSDLRARAASVVGGFDLDAYHDAGIRKAKSMFASSTIQVAYPPLKDLPAYRSDNTSLFKSEPHALQRPATVYAHIPWCSGTCSYCGFARKPIKRDQSAFDAFDNYLELLTRELSLYLLPHVSNLAEQQIHAVYVGGGTPTILTPEQMVRLLTQLRSMLNVTASTEICVEGSPETITTEMVDALADGGCNRVSMGVETFDDTLLAASKIGLRRRHNSEVACNAVSRVRRRIDNVNIDLIRNLPGQNLESIYQDLRRIRELRIPSVTNYHLIIKPNTGFSRLNQDCPGVFPEEFESLVQHAFVREGLRDLGYEEGPVDWFTLDPRLNGSLHQEVKWRSRSDLVGLGRSSYAYHNEVQCQNLKEMSDYEGRLAQGILPIASAAKLSSIEAFHRRIIFGLRYGIQIEPLEHEFGVSVEESFAEQLARLSKAGLISLDNGVLKLTTTGSYFADEIMGEFYSQDVKGMGHSG